MARGQHSVATVSLSWRNRRSPACILFLAAVICTHAGPTYGRVVGRVLRMGMPLNARTGTNTGGDGYRLGQWLPVAVNLRLEQQAEFSGFLRIEQEDRDGDRNYCEVPVNLRADSGGSRIFWLHVVANPRDKQRDDSFAVFLVDQNRESVPVVLADGTTSDRILPPQLPEALDTETRLVLDISETPLVQLDRTAQLEETLRRPLVVARLEAGGLPPIWHGLEMVDYIVWDSPDPDQVDANQVTALIDWVNQGGCLVVGVGQTSQAVGRSMLGQHLPVTLTGQTATARLPGLLQALYRGKAGPDDREKYPQALTVAIAKARAGAVVEAHEDGIDSDVLVRQTVGNGSIVFVGASLRDAMSARAHPLTVVANLLQLRYAAKKDEPNVPSFGYSRQLFPDFHSVIDFQMSVGAYLSIAVLFVTGYILVSTLGVWHWLKSRNLLRHSWTAFAVSALCASAVSLASVRFVQGFGQRVAQLAVVDAIANSSDAQAVCLFGLKTGSHTARDLWLPADFGSDIGPQRTACSLRPLSPDPERDGQGYVAPRQYQIHPALAFLEDVPFRATVKQFEGRWVGRLKGQVRGRIRVVYEGSGDNIGRIQNDSWILNELGMDLHDCFLLQCTQDVTNLPDVRPTRSARVYVHPLGTLKDRQRIANLYDRLYRAEDGEELPSSKLLDRKLETVQRQWTRGFGIDLSGNRTVRQAISIDEHEEILLLLTTFEEFEARDPSSPQQGPVVELERTHVRALDRSCALGRNAAVLVGFADQDGPVRLAARPAAKDGREGNWQPIEPYWSRTLYRVVIPVSR